MLWKELLALNSYTIYTLTPLNLFGKLNSDFYKTVDNEHFKLSYEDGGHIRIAKVKVSITSNAGKDAEKLDHSYIAGRKIKWYSHLKKSLTVSLKTKNWLNHKALFPLLGTYLREMKTYCHTMIAKTGSFLNLLQWVSSKINCGMSNKWNTSQQ